MTIGTLAIICVLGDIVREIQRIGMAKAMLDANWGLIALACSRFMKSLLAVLKNTKQVLRGYRTFTLVQRGKNVFLRAVSPVEEADRPPPGAHGDLKEGRDLT